MTARLTLPLEISEMAEQKCLSAQSLIYDASTEGGRVCVCECVFLHLLHIEYIHVGISNFVRTFIDIFFLILF